MLLIYLSLVLGFIPANLKDTYVVISNLKYPKLALTVGSQDFFHCNLISMELKPILVQNLKDQLFLIQESIFGGVVLKRERMLHSGLRKHNLIDRDFLRTFRHGESLYLKSDKAKGFYDSSRIILKKHGTDYARTFLMINNEECLDAKEKHNSSGHYVEFSKCEKLDSQLWGAFSNNQALDYLNMAHNVDEGDDFALDRLIDRLHEKRGQGFFA